MLHYQSIDTTTLELLKDLQEADFLKDVRLVGGTSLALQIGHRISVDLDLFGKLDMDFMELNERLNTLGREVRIIKNSKNIHIYAIDQIKVDLVNYTYPWLKPPCVSDHLILADIEDIAAMKLAAITGRGTKKDFIDIYFLLQKFSLKELMSFYHKKFADGSEFMVLKSLTYFEDAEFDPMPEMLLPFNWDEAKIKIVGEVDGY